MFVDPRLQDGYGLGGGLPTGPLMSAGGDNAMGLLSNPYLQMGLGILANNQGNYGALGPALGRGMSQGLQSVQASRQMDMQNKLFQMKLKAYEQEQEKQRNQEEAMQRLMNPDAYNVTKEVPVSSFENVPIPAAPDAVAPNFGLQQQETTTMQPQTAFDENRYKQDIVNAGFGDEILKRQLFPAAPELQFAPDGTVVNMGDPSLIGKKFGKEEEFNPNKPFLMVDGKVVPNEAYQQYELEKASRSASRITNSPVFQQEKEENKAVGKFFGEQYADIQKSGLQAGGKINKVQRLNQLLEGVNTGKLTPLGVEIASTAQSLGINIDPKLGNKQAAEALTNEMALELRNPSGGAGMPGAMSDKDREFLKQMVPGIEKTPQGRKLVTESMLKLAEREKQVAKMARQYRRKRGTIDEGFFEELQSYSDANPLFKGAPATGKGKVKFLGFEE